MINVGRPMKGWIYNEKNIPAKETAEKHGTWLQKAHEHKEWQIGAEEKKTKGKKEADSLILPDFGITVFVWSQTVRQRCL